MGKNKKIIFGIVTLLVVYYGLFNFFTRIDEAGVQNTILQANSGENPTPGSMVHDLPVEPAAEAARKDLALKLSLSEKSIVIMLIEEKTWTNGCLDLGGLDEMCTTALVPGFRVEMQVKGQTYIYHTDKTGTSVRVETWTYIPSE